jgi:hypothetical protein
MVSSALVLTTMRLSGVKARARTAQACAAGWFGHPSLQTYQRQKTVLCPDREPGAVRANRQGRDGGRQFFDHHALSGVICTPHLHVTCLIAADNAAIGGVTGQSRNRGGGGVRVRVSRPEGSDQRRMVRSRPPLTSRLACQSTARAVTWSWWCTRVLSPLSAAKGQR